MYHHKRNRKLVTNKKAFSSIVGAIFAILIIVSLTGTFFVWSIQQNTRYVDAVRGVDQLALDRQSESLNVTSNFNYTGSGNSINVNVSVLNDGPIYVNITTLWVQDLDNSQNYGYSTDLNHILLTGEDWEIIETVPVLFPVGSDEFCGWLITSRGNVVPLYPAHAKGDTGANGTQGSPGEKGDVGASGATWIVESRDPLASDGDEGDFFLNTISGYVYHKTTLGWGTPIGNLKGQQGPTGGQGPAGKDFNATGDVHLFNGTTDSQSALVAQGIGVICMDFSRFYHYEFTSDKNGQNISSLSPVYLNYTIGNLGSGGYLLFHVVLGNMDPHRDIVLSNYSAVYILGANTGGGSIKFASWRIATVSNGVLNNNPIYGFTLPKNDTNMVKWTDVYFYGEYPVGSNKIDAGLYPMNIMLYGKIGPDDYGQNVPFVSLLFK